MHCYVGVDLVWGVRMKLYNRELALAMELRTEGCSWRNIAWCLGCNWEYLRDRVKQRQREGMVWSEYA